MFFLAIPSTIFASETEIIIDGEKITLNEPLFIENGRLYVPVRFISDSFDADVIWNKYTRTVSIDTSTGDAIDFSVNTNKIQLNSKSYLMDVTPLIKQGRTYLPVRHVTELLHSKAVWDNKSKTLTIESVPLHTVLPGETLSSISEEYNTTVGLLAKRNGLKENEIHPGEKLKVIIPLPLSYDPKVDLLARLIEAESSGEPFEGKVAVGSVIINRMADSRFPKTVKGVIFQENQFTPVETGIIYTIEPSPEAIAAAEQALSGEKPVKNALFFFNPSLINNQYLEGKQVIAKIGNHSFVR